MASAERSGNRRGATQRNDDAHVECKNISIMWDAHGRFVNFFSILREHSFVVCKEITIMRELSE